MRQLRPTLPVLSLTAPGQRAAGAGVRTALRIAFAANDPHAAPLAGAVRSYVEEARAFGLREEQITRALRLHVHQVGYDVPEPDLAEVLREVEAIAARAMTAPVAAARDD